MQLTMTRPDDWHVHFRDGAMMQTVVPETARDFGRAIVMPNLVPPIVTGAQAQAYRDRILAARSDGSDFTPLMTLYLTEQTDPADLARAHADGIVTAAKLYPAGATTNSASGVRDFDKIAPVLDKMSEIGMPMCLHGEVTDAEIDIFDREAVFIDRVLDPLRRRHPQLRVVMEHITTSDGATYAADGDNLGATITTHHLMINRNHLLVGGIRPHYYCLPVAKRENHRRALVAAATSGNPTFFLGTDSAPHLDAAKLSACGCAGVFSATNTMSCLAEVFETEGALDKLEGFAAHHGADFYGLARNTATLTLEKGAPDYPAHITTPEGELTVFDPDRPLTWRIKR